MRTAQQWLQEYGASHQHPTNKLLHWLCVPPIVLTVVGLLWALPVPSAFHAASPWLNWATIAIAATVLYYASLSYALAIGAAVALVALALIVSWLDSLATPLWAICLGIFIIAWIGQFIGHAIEGKQPSFFKDLQFLLIGPMWLLSFIYRKVGSRY